MLYLEPTVRGEGHLNWKEERDEGRGRKREEGRGREEKERGGRKEGMRRGRCMWHVVFTLNMPTRHGIPDVERERELLQT